MCMYISYMYFLIMKPMVLVLLYLWFIPVCPWSFWSPQSLESVSEDNAAHAKCTQMYTIIIKKRCFVISHHSTATLLLKRYFFTLNPPINTTTFLGFVLTVNKTGQFICPSVTFHKFARSQERNVIYALGCHAATQRNHASDSGVPCSARQSAFIDSSTPSLQTLSHSH